MPRMTQRVPSRRRHPYAVSLRLECVDFGGAGFVYREYGHRLQSELGRSVSFSNLWPVQLIPVGPLPLICSRR